MKVFGIKQCDTCRKALKYLCAESIAHEFIDLRASPVDDDVLSRWVSELGTDRLINRRSTTWRQLENAQREAVMAGDVGMLAANPTLIKRPLVDWGSTLTVGFEVSQWQHQL